MVIEFPWWFYALAVVPALMPTISAFLSRQSESKLFDEVGIRQLRQMSGQQFEKFLVHLFSDLGYRVESTPHQGDFGADLIVTMPGGARVAVRTKHWAEEVGMRAVQEAHGAAAVYKCQHSMVITSSEYSEAAKTTAEATGTILWGTKEIAEAIDNARLARERRQSKGWARVA